MHEDYSEIESRIVRQATVALDDSIEHLDAATLSRLNRARQAALSLQDSREAFSWRQWLPAGALAAAFSIAVVMPGFKPADGGIGNQASTLPAFAELTEDPELNVRAVAEDQELLEDLDMMLWLLNEDVHAS